MCGPARQSFPYPGAVGYRPHGSLHRSPADQQGIRPVGLQYFEDQRVQAPPGASTAQCTMAQWWAHCQSSMSAEAFLRLVVQQQAQAAYRATTAEVAFQAIARDNMLLLASTLLSQEYMIYRPPFPQEIAGRQWDLPTYAGPAPIPLRPLVNQHMPGAHMPHPEGGLFIDQTDQFLIRDCPDGCRPPPAAWTHLLKLLTPRADCPPLQDALSRAARARISQQPIPGVPHPLAHPGPRRTTSWVDGATAPPREPHLPPHMVHFMGPQLAPPPRSAPHQGKRYRAPSPARSYRAPARCDGYSFQVPPSLRAGPTAVLLAAHDHSSEHAPGTYPDVPGPNPPDSPMLQDGPQPPAEVPAPPQQPPPSPPPATARLPSQPLPQPLPEPEPFAVCPTARVPVIPRRQREPPAQQPELLEDDDAWMDSYPTLIADPTRPHWTLDATPEELAEEQAEEAAAEQQQAAAARRQAVYRADKNKRRIEWRQQRDNGKTPEQLALAKINRNRDNRGMPRRPA